MHTTQVSGREAAGPVVSPAHPAVHNIVHRTAMHGTFALQSIKDWVERDEARRQAGVVDSLDYLVKATRFLMNIALLNRGLSQICSSEKERVDEMRSGMERTFAVLRSVKLATTEMEAQCSKLNLHAVQLETAAMVHTSAEAEIAGLLAGLQLRVDTLLLPPGQILPLVRAN